MSEVTLSNTLNSVSEAYIPGTVKYYEGMNPSPWQKAHDELERVLLTKNESLVIPALRIFEDTARSLIAQYARAGEPMARLTGRDAIQMTPDKIDHWSSITNNQCYKCLIKKDLRLEPISDSDECIEVRVVCNGCRRS